MIMKTIDACPKDRICQHCFYADSCPYWQDEDNSAPHQVPLTEVHAALCAGRHEIPAAVDGSIFDEIVDPTDIAGLERTATEQLQGIKNLHLYVTGLTQALIATLNAAKITGTQVVAYHYDRDTGEYLPQIVR